MQLKFKTNCHGGRRSGAGRKRLRSKGVAHRVREKVTRHTPLHVNFKYRTSIRNKFCLRLLKRAILNARRQGLRIVHFSLQHSHVHLIVESTNNETLTRGMRSLLVTFAKGLRQGRVQLERYHLHVLRSACETRNAVHYVLFNRQKHEKGRYSVVDEYSSLLSLPDAMALIRKFVVAGRMTIKVERGERNDVDVGKCFLLSRALT